MSVFGPKFGTDGLRGRFDDDLTPAVARALGHAAAEVLNGTLFLIGSDTRESCPHLVAGLAAGIRAAGGDIDDLGVVPTPTVAWAAAERGLPAAMVSASHNPYADNGIKLFAAGGLKLRDDVQQKIEDRYLQLYTDIYSNSSPQVDGQAGKLDFAAQPHGLGQRWVDHVVGSVGRDALAGHSIVLDCAHGAAYQLGPEAFLKLGASVTVLGNEPTGVNINDGVGSTHPDQLQAAVRKQGASLGLAFDGDADRLIAVDGRGSIVDGDRVLAVLANDWATRGLLRNNTVVVTIMTNLGFHRAMAAAGIEVICTAVGDRHVLAALDDHNLSLGGEQSGHIICRDLATTGDGVLAGILLADLVARTKMPLAELADNSMTTVPQILRNVELARKDPNAGALIADEVAAVEARFGPDGRVVVRPSGTEALLRVMVEHIDEAVAVEACDSLVAAAQAATLSG